MKKFLRPALSILILVITLLLFVRFFAEHPQYIKTLKTISPWTVVWVLLLNVAMVIVIAGIGYVAVAMCGKRIKLRDNILLTAYSSILNFFGPLQSGPGMRAVYLKSKYQVRLRDYTLATLLSLALFALFSAFFLFMGALPWWQTLLALLAVAVVCWQVISFFIKRDKNSSESTFRLRGDLLAYLIGLVLLQTLITIAWYYIELNAVNNTISVKQAMSYAGAANFSLFVSLTPDGVGIREAFLIFSRHLHHVSTPDIVNANVIDRGVYVLFLSLLFVVVLSLHAKDKLQIKNLARKPSH